MQAICISMSKHNMRFFCDKTKTIHKIIQNIASSYPWISYPLFTAQRIKKVEFMLFRGDTPAPKELSGIGDRRKCKAIMFRENVASKTGLS